MKLISIGKLLTIIAVTISDAKAFTCNQNHKWHGKATSPMKNVGEYQIEGGPGRSY